MVARSYQTPFIFFIARRMWNEQMRFSSTLMKAPLF
jgi:hypothetical protein